MEASTIQNGLSKRAPTIVVVSLCAALLGAWADLPTWLPYGFAIAVAALALVMWATRGRLGPASAGLSDDADRGWLAHELAGNGTPPGFYVLGFFGIVTVALTGFQSAYSMLAWAALALTVTWGIVNVSYPADDDPAN